MDQYTAEQLATIAGFLSRAVQATTNTSHALTSAGRPETA